MGGLALKSIYLTCIKIDCVALMQPGSAAARPATLVSALQRAGSVHPLSRCRGRERGIGQRNLMRRESLLEVCFKAQPLPPPGPQNPTLYGHLLVEFHNDGLRIWRLVREIPRSKWQFSCYPR